MSSGYIIACVQVTNPEQYAEYRKWSTEAMQVHGAEVCVRGGQVAVLEGDWAPERVVVLKSSTSSASVQAVSCGSLSIGTTKGSTSGGCTISRYCGLM